MACTRKCLGDMMPLSSARVIFKLFCNYNWSIDYKYKNIYTILGKYVVFSI